MVAPLTGHPGVLSRLDLFRGAFGSPLVPCPQLLSETSEQAFSPFLDSGNITHPPHTSLLRSDYMLTSCQVLGWEGGHSEHEPSLSGLQGPQVAHSGHSLTRTALTALCLASQVAWAICSSGTPRPSPQVSSDPSLPGGPQILQLHFLALSKCSPAAGRREELDTSTLWLRDSKHWCVYTSQLRV